MSKDYREVQLETLNSGAVRDLFEEEFSKVLKNIADNNTNASKERSVSIVVKIKPSKDRSRCETLVQVTSKMAPLKPHESFIVLENTGNEVKAFTMDTNQQELGISVDDSANVTPFKAVAAGGGK